MKIFKSITENLGIILPITLFILFIVLLPTTIITSIIHAENEKTMLENIQIGQIIPESTYPHLKIIYKDEHNTQYTGLLSSTITINNNNQTVKSIMYK